MARHRLFLTLLLLTCAAEMHAKSLCKSDEKTYFSCRVKSGKTISLCGNVYSEELNQPAQDAEDAWLQYRFGKANNIELTYPSRKADSLNKFKSESVLTHAAEREITFDAIYFVNGGIGYGIETGVSDDGAEFSGIKIGDPQKFGLKTTAKKKDHYPNVSIPCNDEVETKGFVGLTRYLKE